MKTKQNEFRKAAQRISRLADLPQRREPASYEVRNGDAKPRVVTLSKRQRQVIDLLMQGPVYCASPVRLSDIVFVLKREIGLEVETLMFPGDKARGGGDFGIYVLQSQVGRLQDLEVAA